MGYEDIIKLFGVFAEKPSGIIYIGIVILLAISEWKNPSNFTGLVAKVIVLIIAFVLVTIFNSQYFKWFKKSARNPK